jgi:CRP-like cAMP-binding protein
VLNNSQNITVFLKSISSFTDEEINDFMKIGKDVEMKKGDFIISAGQTCKSFSFIHEGTFSFLIMNNDGEHVKDFSGSNKFITSYSSFITQTPSQIFIRAEENAILTQWSFDTYKQLLHSSEHWKQFALKIANYLYLRKEKREISLLTETAEQRYLNMLKEFPHIVQHVPQYLIASYLGIKPQSLSRIRNQIARPQKLT